MNDDPHPIFQLLQTDLRYQLNAYQFVRDSLAYAQEVLPNEESEEENEPHLTGQQLCEAIRLFAIDQFGYMSKTVLNNWGIQGTNDFGEIVYNLIDIGMMKKSETDEREHFADVYSFEKAFVEDFQIDVADLG
ncbi:MAG: Minf_1886 family protein [Pirellulaceae bacterium]